MSHRHKEIFIFGHIFWGLKVGTIRIKIIRVSDKGRILNLISGRMIKKSDTGFPSQVIRSVSSEPVALGKPQKLQKELFF